MGGCSVMGCKEKWSRGKHFYRFPRDLSKRLDWAIFTRRGSAWTPKDSNIICQSHFEDQYLERKKSRLMPCKDAVPTIYYLSTDAGIEKLIVSYPYSEDQLPEVLFQPEMNEERDKKKLEKAKKREIINDKKELKQNYKLLFEKNQKLYSYKKICRFCAQKKDCTIELKNLEKWEIDLNYIMAVLELTINSHLSEIICEDCFTNLVTFTTFKNVCKEAELKILKELVALDPENFQIENFENAIEQPIEEDEYVDELDEYVDEMESNKSHELDLDLKLDPFDENIESVDNIEFTIEEPVKLEEEDQVLFLIDNSIAGNQMTTNVQQNNEVEEIKEQEETNKNLYVLKNFECLYCKKTFGGKKTFQAHVCSIKEISCEICDKVFNRAQAYRSHMSSVHGENRDQTFTCPMCKIIVKGCKSNFDKHRKNCVKRNDPIECDICQKMLPTLTGYSMHKLFHESKNSEGKSFLTTNSPGLCEICGKKYKTQRDYKTHMKIKHLEIDKVFQCEICLKILPHRNAYHKHKINVHKEERSICDICNKEFKNKVLLRKHIMYHDESKKVHACLTCGKTYFTNVALKRHMVSHTSLKAYTCNHCEMAYTTNQQLKHHKLRNHANEQYDQTEVFRIIVK